MRRCAPRSPGELRRGIHVVLLLLGAPPRHERPATVGAATRPVGACVPLRLRRELQDARDEAFGLSGLLTRLGQALQASRSCANKREKLCTKAESDTLLRSRELASHFPQQGVVVLKFAFFAAPVCQLPAPWVEAAAAHRAGPPRLSAPPGRGRCTPVRNVGAGGGARRSITNLLPRCHSSCMILRRRAEGDCRSFAHQDAEHGKTLDVEAGSEVRERIEEAERLAERSGGAMQGGLSSH